MSYGRATNATRAYASESSAESRKGLLTRFQTHERVVARATRTSSDQGNGSIASEEASVLGSEHGEHASVSSWRLGTRASANASPTKANVGSGRTGGRKNGSSSTFDIAENARLALEAKDVQLAKMAARLEAVMREKSELEAGRTRGAMDAFDSRADDLDAEMKAALRGLRGESANGGNEGYSAREREGFSRDRRVEERSDDEGEYEDAGPSTSRGAEGARRNGAVASRAIDDDDDQYTPKPPMIKPGVRVEGGYLTPSGRVVGSALKGAESSAMKSGGAGGTAAARRVEFNREDQFSDAGVPFEAAEVVELQHELREVRGALKSAFSVSEQLVEQCEKKNVEIKEKNAALKLAREEVVKARDDLREAREKQVEAEKRVDALLRGDFNVNELRKHLSTTLRALDDANAFTKQVIKLIQQSVGVSAELSPNVVFSILPILSGLAIRGEMAEAMVEAGVLARLVNALELFKADRAICANVLDAIQAVCRTGLDASVVTQDEQLMSLRGTLTDDAIRTCAAAVVECGRRHAADAVVSESVACVALAFAEFGDFANIQYLVNKCSIIDALVTACLTHANDEGVQRATTCALAAYAVCDGSTKRVVDDLGGFALIKRCVYELNVDDAVRLFPQTRRWISSNKSSKPVDDVGDDAGASDDDVGDNL